MEAKFEFKNVDYSESLVEHINERLLKLKKHQIGFMKAEIIVSKNKKMTEVSMVIHRSGKEVFASAKSTDFYIAADKAVDKAQSQMKRIKERVRLLRRHPLTSQFRETKNAS